ncbi:ribonuclease p protein subunit p25 [Nannochloropsis oceanica]
MELPCDKQQFSVPSGQSDNFGAAGVQVSISAPAPQRYRSKYRLLACHRDDAPAKTNEVRVTYQGPVKSYLGYAMALFEERGARAVALKGMGRAIHKALTVAEILKRSLPGLHQRTEIGSLPFKEVWAPLEEGLNRVESTRYISSVLITLSKDPPPLDIRHFFRIIVQRALRLEGGGSVSHMRSGHKEDSPWSL